MNDEQRNIPDAIKHLKKAATDADAATGKLEKAILAVSTDPTVLSAIDDLKSALNDYSAAYDEIVEAIKDVLTDRLI